VTPRPARRLGAVIGAGVLAVVLTGGASTAPEAVSAAPAGWAASPASQQVWDAPLASTSVAPSAWDAPPASVVPSASSEVPAVAHVVVPPLRPGASSSRLFLAAASALSALAAGSTTAATATGFVLERTTLANGRTAVLRWNPCQVITYKINVDAVPGVALKAAVVREIRSAVGKLALAANLTYLYRGATSEVPRTTNIDRQSAELVIAVTTPDRTDIAIGHQVLGFGGYHYWRWSGANAKNTPVDGAAIARGWVVLDRAGWLALPAGFGPGMRQGNVILHELGHTVGLDHVSDRHELMYPTLLASGPNGYAAGDRAGLVRLGRSAGCIAIPPGVITDLK